MTKTFTENDLLRFVYGELTPREKRDLELTLLTDGPLRNQLKELELLKSGLSKVQQKAPQGVVDKILKYSQNFHSEELSD